MVLAHPLGSTARDRHLRSASRYAARSRHPIHKMGAVVIRGGNIVGAGFNKMHSHPRSRSYDNMIHAELSAILSAGNVWGTIYGDLYVVRITKGGAFGTSKPCSDCMDLIKEAGITSVTYIDEKGRIKKDSI